MQEYMTMQEIAKLVRCSINTVRKYRILLFPEVKKEKGKVICITREQAKKLVKILPKRNIVLENGSAPNLTKKNVKNGVVDNNEKNFEKENDDPFVLIQNMINSQQVMLTNQQNILNTIKETHKLASDNRTMTLENRQVIIKHIEQDKNNMLEMQGRLYLKEPEKKPFKELNQIIHLYARKNNRNIQHTWYIFYSEFNAYYSVNVFKRATNSKMSTADVIRDMDKEHEALVLGKKLFLDNSGNIKLGIPLKVYV